MITPQYPSPEGKAQLMGSLEFAGVANEIMNEMISQTN
jgi:hypothetical protein